MEEERGNACRTVSHGKRSRRIPFGVFLTFLLVGAAAVHASERPTPVRPEPLRLEELVQRLREANKEIRLKRAERDIAATGIDRAAAAMQPAGKFGATRSRNNQPNTYEEALSRSLSSNYLRDGNDYSASVSQLLPTGARLELGSTLSNFITNINQQAAGRPPGAHDNRTNWALTLVQPMARDGGTEVTSARGRVAELDLAVADHIRLESESVVVASAVMGYYELVLAQHREAAAQEKLDTALRLVAQARELARKGLLPEVEIWEVQNTVSRYTAGLDEAKQGVLELQDRLNTFLLASSLQDPRRWQAVDPLPEIASHLKVSSLDEVYRHALESRQDFQKLKKQLEREGVQLGFVTNQAQHRLDLTVSYGQGGLAYSTETALTQALRNAYPRWSLGLQLEIPLGKNLEGQANIAAAALRRDNALLELKALEVQIANDLHTSINMMTSAARRSIQWQEVAQREQQQVEFERQRFAAGRSAMREILMREERAVNARLALLEQQASYARARVVFESAQGVLLQRWSR
jgi:outer membrane protein TolC